MIETLTICQDLLTRHLSPVENRADEQIYPAEDSEITEQVQGFSIAPQYSLKQLREIERRGIKKCKLDSQRLEWDSSALRSRH